MEGKVKRLIISIIIVTYIRCSHIQGAPFYCEDGCTCTGVEINCSDNDLDAIPKFETIQGANIVDLSNNHIEEIEESLPWQGIEQLQFLYLNTNSIYYINENAFVTLVNLEYVDLSNNYIEMLPDNIFAMNMRLTKLALQGNSFQTNTPRIASSSLKYLDLSFCKLSTFTIQNIQNLPKLKHLNLQVNNLVYLQPDIFSKHYDLFLVLSYNSWACNCSTVELYKWALVNQPRVIIDEKCNNKNNIHVNLFNKTRDFLYKEGCDIDENTFGTTPMKNLSLTKAPPYSTNSSIILNDNGVQDDNELFIDPWIVFIVIALGIVLVALAIGVVVGVYVGSYMLRTDYKSYRKSINCELTIV